jgi:glycosyltransferase involved in cell wall biosynthesis
MKIVHIITRFILGGAQENTLITCRLLAEHGHDVTLITGPAMGPEGALFEQARNAGFDIIVIPQMRREINPLNDLPACLEIKKHLKRIKPDIVHTHSAKAGILGRFAAFSLKGKFQRKKAPFVVHTLHGLSFHPYQSPMLNRLYIAIEKAAAKKTDFFISVADAMTQKSLQEGIGRPDRFVTAYSAIEEDDFLSYPGDQAVNDFRRKYGINEQAIVLVTIARLAELKGHDYIIDSAVSLAGDYENCVWLFVGDGELSQQIKQRIRLESLGYRFKFTGLLGPHQIPLAIHASDILVHCSLREGLARVLPQAMLCAKAVVSFDIDGANEVVNENTGLLIEPENVDDLTQACARLIEDPDLRITLGENARESVRTKFAPETMLSTIEKVYAHLLEGKPLDIRPSADSGPAANAVMREDES